MTALHHRLDVYDVDLYLVTNKRDWSTLRRRLSLLDPSPPESAGASQFSLWVPNDGTASQPINWFWLDVQAHRTTSYLVDTCAHEATHAAAEIMGWIGHDIRGHQQIDEPVAYLIGWLTRWLFDGTQQATSKTG